MNKQEKEKLVRQFLDGEAGPSDEAEALRIMAEDSEMRELLHLEIDLNRAFHQERDEAASFAVPEGFNDEVMKAVKQREPETQDREAPATENILDRIQQGIDQILQPRTVQWRPVYGLAAVLAVVAIFIGLSIENGTSPSTQKMAQQQTESTVSQAQAVKASSKASDKSNYVWARFFYVNEEAKSVAVAGDFSNWEPVQLNQKTVNGKKVWTGKVHMERGEHRYMYIINGEKWKTDPLASRYKKDGFGHRNAVLSL